MMFHLRYVNLINQPQFQKYSYYNIVKKRTSSQNYLPLYESKYFATNNENIDTILENQTALIRFKQISPILMFSNLSFIQTKKFVTKMQFNPDNKKIRIKILLLNGFCQHDFYFTNIIPWSFRDLSAGTRIPQPLIPPFIDDEMVYINKILKQVYIFQQDGTWIEETVNHPSLSLSQFKAKQWIYRWDIF